MHITSEWSVAATRHFGDGIWHWHPDADQVVIWSMHDDGAIIVTTRRNEETKNFELLVKKASKIPRVKLTGKSKENISKFS